MIYEFMNLAPCPSRSPPDGLWLQVLHLYPNTVDPPTCKASELPSHLIGAKATNRAIDPRTELVVLASFIHVPAPAIVNMARAHLAEKTVAPNAQLDTAAVPKALDAKRQDLRNAAAVTTADIFYSLVNILLA